LGWVASEQVELIDPAVVGTLNVLNSCAKAKSVRRVVLTSSTAAVRMRADLHNITAPLDESVWSDLQFCTNYKVRVCEPCLNSGDRGDLWA
jgi:nucleoside-diphosphate-sugar epimerase